MEYVMTIEEEGPSVSEEEEEEIRDTVVKTSSKKKKKKNKKNKKKSQKKAKVGKSGEDEVDPSFTFEAVDFKGETDEGPLQWDFKDPSATGQLTASNDRGVSFAKSLDEKIQKRLKSKEKAESDDGEKNDFAIGFSDEEDGEAEDEEGKEEEGGVASQTMSRVDDPKNPALTSAKNGDFESDLKNSFFDDESSSEKALASSFLELNLSRPLLRAVTRLRYQRPTPIQSRCIPLALAGRDICASAQTGSGKTAAFLLPVFERMLFRPRDVAVTRVLIITPTRELATQIHSMGHKLAQFSKIRIALVVGGLSLKGQSAELRARPDVVVCTPGRMIDHIQNTMSVHMDDIEVLILDEADRLLDEGFTDEVHELVKHCSRGRQTMLFSATMTDKVEDLVKLSLNRPVRVSVGEVDNVADRLVQEFVRIRTRRTGTLDDDDNDDDKNDVGEEKRGGRKSDRKKSPLDRARIAMEEDREAVVAAICVRSCSSHTILFCDTKRQAHRMVIVLGLLGLKAAELHGNLTQMQRLDSLELFKSGEMPILVATDLASRGLDVPGVETVINMSMPRQIERYIHRVGRTARAGRSGRSITLVGDVGRTNMKRAVKQHRKKTGSDAGLRSRKVPAAVILHWKRRIAAIEKDVDAILDEEKMERKLLRAEMEAQRAVNMVAHSEEIKSRPPRTWFQSETEKQAVKDKTAAAARQAFAEAKARVKKKRLSMRQVPKKPGAHRMTRKKRRRQAMDREIERDEELARKASRIGSKIRNAKRKEKKEQSELLGRKKRAKKKKKPRGGLSAPEKA
eukprot:g4730.t1